MAARLSHAAVLGDGCRTGEGKCLVTATWETRNPPVPNGDFRMHGGELHTKGQRVAVQLGALTPLSEGVGPDPAAMARGDGKARPFSIGAVVQSEDGLRIAGLVPKLRGCAAPMPAQGIVSCQPSRTDPQASTCTVLAAGQAQPAGTLPQRAFDGSPSWDAWTQRPLPPVDGLPGFGGPAAWESPTGRVPYVPNTVGAMIHAWGR